MIQQSTLQFLKALAKHNNRDWFLANKAKYDLAKADYLLFVEAVLNGIQKTDNTLAELAPKQCVFRINRDVRFSKNKDPYKTNFGASFSKGGKKIQCAGYYFHIEPGASFIGGGLWMPMAPELKKVRQEIDYCFKEFSSVIQQKKFQTNFNELDSSNKLVRPPKDYEIDNPGIEYLKLKSFIVSMPITDAELLDKDLVKKTISTFQTMTPFISFLNRAIDI
jgi:uncharacterized protein (TIGR02453 family)